MFPDLDTLYMKCQSLDGTRQFEYKLVIHVTLIQSTKYTSRFESA